MQPGYSRCQEEGSGNGDDAPSYLKKLQAGYQRVCGVVFENAAAMRCLGWKGESQWRQALLLGGSMLCRRRSIVDGAKERLGEHPSNLQA